MKQAGLLQAEIDRLRAALMEWENREGSCCPEGVPFERVIQKLKAELESAKRDNAQLTAALVRIAQFPIHSEPVGGAYGMQDIARAALNSVCPECGGTGGIDSGGSTPWGAPISLPCPSCGATRRENSTALRELLLPTIDLLQLAISRGCWPHEDIVHNELARLRDLCEKGPEK